MPVFGGVQERPRTPVRRAGKPDYAGRWRNRPAVCRIGWPWRLDSKKNDLAAFSDSQNLFPGYGEWGASMEIRGNGQMSWYIGAEGWHGIYAVRDGVLHAQLTSDLEQTTQLWDFRVTAESEVPELEMDYQGMTVYWVYGDQEDTSH